MTRVRVLHASLAVGGHARDCLALLKRLPYAKRIELEGRDDGDRHASLAGLALVLEGAGRLRGSTVHAGELKFPCEGKPRLAGGPFFSVSHCAATVAAALCVGSDLGLDIEALTPRPAGMGEERRRLERWTATEAVIKAAGRGLRDARQVGLDEGLSKGTLAGRDYRLTPVRISADVVAHLATPAPVDSLVIEEGAAAG